MKAGYLKTNQSAKTARIHLATAVLCFSLFAVSVKTAWSAPKDDAKDFPKFNAFSAVVEDYFAGKKAYRPGDIISQGEVRDVFKKLKSMGWDVADQEEIRDLVLPDSSYMVVQLRTKRGRPFMSGLAKTPAAYDRLERFLRLPLSKREFQGLLDGPDGYKMFEYMVTAPGGIVLGQQLSNIKEGRDFNKPTGHIYTVEQLVKRLSESHATYVAALKAAEEN